jgi:regulatory protein
MAERPERRLRRPDEQRLFNRAVYYLSRYAASERHLADVLRRKALREAAAHEVPPERVEAMIAAVVERLRLAGYLDDGRFAASRARSLADRGRSLARIRAKLARQGVARDAAADALASLREERPEPELAAAVALARRRRLGPWRPQGERADARQRDVAVLARAGFPPRVALEVVDAPDPEALEERLAELAGPDAG